MDASLLANELAESRMRRRSQVFYVNLTLRMSMIMSIEISS